MLPQRSALRALSAASATGLFAALALAGPAAAQPASGLETVATFAHQVTGVGVSEGGRVFVNFPRWSEDAPVSVAEVKDGRAVPYPDAEWNSWRNVRKDEISPGDHFVCVQSVVADGRGSLWVLDPAAPALAAIVKGGPKLVRIDLRTDKVTKTYPFDEAAAPPGTYLNDVRFSPDGRWAYVTDSGRGAILVLDLETGRIRRLLDGAPSTQSEPGVLVHIDGEPLRGPDGRAPSFAADGIALSPDGETLYWQAIASHTLYSVPTAALRDEALDGKALEARVTKAGTTVVADGILMTRSGRFYFTAPEDNAVKRRQGPGQFATIVQSERLRWPDTMAEGPDGAIYVTASHIPDSRMFKAITSVAVPTALFKFKPADR